MEKTLKFKTNIKCMGCVATVTPALDEAVGSGNWEVDLQSADRQLTVHTENADAASVVAALAKTGYRQKRLYTDNAPGLKIGGIVSPNPVRRAVCNLF